MRSRFTPQIDPLAMVESGGGWSDGLMYPMQLQQKIGRRRQSISDLAHFLGYCRGSVRFFGKNLLYYRDSHL